MSKQYCFDVINPDNEEYDIDKLKKYVTNLYVGKKNKFLKDEKLPFVTIHSRSENSVCILITSSGKKNIELIKSINEKYITAKQLKWKKNISLSSPYEFLVDTAVWWDKKEQNTEKKWNTLKHKGPYFVDLVEDYEYLGATLTYEEKEYSLTPEEERIAGFYAKRIISEKLGNVVDAWTKDSLFNKNFWNDFKKYLHFYFKKIW